MKPQLLLLGIMFSNLVCAQGRVILPPNPVEDAKHALANRLINDAYVLIRGEHYAQAVAKLNEASAVEFSIRDGGFRSRAKFEQARLFVRMNQPADALAAYRSVFCWDSRRGDLATGVGGASLALEYAILLARQGRDDDAKAMYYYVLRNEKSSSRYHEPTPFLTVFDPEPEGNCWQYTPQRLEAAAKMLQAMNGGHVVSDPQTEISISPLISSAKELAPDWFYPYLYGAAKRWRDPRGTEWLAQAESLARPGLEREIVARYREQLAEHKANIEAAETPLAGDDRPMTDGKERRSRMQCLRPNEQVLRRLSIEWPNR